MDQNMPPETKAIATTSQRQTTQVQTILVPRNFDQLVTFAEMAAVSGMVPKSYENKPGAIMLAVQMGSELGLSPMQSITSIAVIGNRPGVFGDALIGLCRQSPICEDIIETIEGEGENRVAKCIAKRRGSTPVTGAFSVADARRAGLWGKSGPWTQYPDRMLKSRARGFTLRDAFPDLLRGLKTVEELQDTPTDTFRGHTLEAETDTRPVKRSVRDWLDDIREELATPPYTKDAVNHMVSREDVKAAYANLTGAALQALMDIIRDATERATRAEEASDAPPVDELPGHLTTPQPVTGPDLPDAETQTGVGDRVSEPTDDTEHLLSSPANAERLLRSVEQVKQAPKDSHPAWRNAGLPPKVEKQPEGVAPPRPFDIAEVLELLDNEADNKTWMLILKNAWATCQSFDDRKQIRMTTSVSKAWTEAPAAVKKRIEGWYRASGQRLAEQSFPGDPLPEDDWSGPVRGDAESVREATSP